MSLIENDPELYPKNINLQVPQWLDTLSICFSIFNLSLAGITIVFQFRHPKSRRNMGRFFLLILILQTLDKTNIFIQELFFRDLSVVFYEVKYDIEPKQFETKLCIFFGFIKTIVDFLCQFYCLWLAVLIKQILKDPIHRLNRYIYFYHGLTFIICMLLVFYVQLSNGFGVEETMQCGIKHTPGLDDEYILLVPFLLVPIDIWLTIKIMRQTPFIVRQSAYLIVDHASFLCLATCTLCERTFFGYAIRFYKWVFRIDQEPKPLIQFKANDSFKNMIDGQTDGTINKTPLLSSNANLDSDEDDFEAGNNQVELKDDIDIEDEQKFKKLIGITDEPPAEFQLVDADPLAVKLEKDNDVNHIIDMAEFFKKFEDICATDVTNGNKVQVKITEYCPELLRPIRKHSGYSEEYLMNSFSPRENYAEMTKFQEGSGKSASFFFFTANKKFVIKTLKDSELELLARKGVLEKYYNHITKYPKSLLARYYAVLKVKIKYMQPINIIIMDNLMGDHAEDAFRVYDLKGSTFNRMNSNPSSDLSVRKDLNFLDDRSMRMQVKPKIKKEILRRMERDKEFLKTCELMDYSLLIIFFKKGLQEMRAGSSSYRKVSMVVRTESEGNGKVVVFQEIKEELPNRQNSLNIFGVSPSINPHPQIENDDIPDEKSNSILEHLGNNQNNSKDQIRFNNPRTDEFIQFTSDQDPNLYYRIGIIDYLQKYNRRKQLETKWLELRNRHVAPDTFSCVHPKLYGDRFYKFMQTNLFTPEAQRP
ncbi:saicar synthase-like protein [Stylonychia lemnae]|uniref:Saicar synthase-like protein n=1 Tax=Stylonychia lemnae TaxID=5949 RepID=A0A078B9H0_STYLE|nr:saicar synthase-like protein [Stylonychia lemnae]|eukprot:CDW91170.1 saicar synthase-like protein [Stylonychia lemnae]